MFLFNVTLTFSQSKKSIVGKYSKKCFVIQKGFHLKLPNPCTKHIYVENFSIWISTLFLNILGKCLEEKNIQHLASFQNVDILYFHLYT
jgi:hypothetical protein